MELVVDANILFAALIKESTTATLVFSPLVKLYAPNFVVEEFMKYSELIQKKMKRTNEQFVTIMHLLHQIITVVPEEEYEEEMGEAKEISPDEKDVMYLALALKLKCAIWSNDSRLKEQNNVHIYSTKEVIGYLIGGELNIPGSSSKVSINSLGEKCSCNFSFLPGIRVSTLPTVNTPLSNPALMSSGVSPMNATCSGVTPYFPHTYAAYGTPFTKLATSPAPLCHFWFPKIKSK